MIGRAKRGFLVVYDYGTGGLWAVILSGSPAEIASKYPKLRVLEERPSWMTEEVFNEIRDRDTFDIDDPPTSWLSEMVR